MSWTTSLALLTNLMSSLTSWLFHENTDWHVYIFHTIYPTRQNWQMIMSQTKIFNFFPGSVHAFSMIKILSYFASRNRNTYIANWNIWINWLYFEISNSRQKQCLTIDTRDINDLGPAKFRTQADSGYIFQSKWRTNWFQKWQHSINNSMS